MAKPTNLHVPAVIVISTIFASILSPCYQLVPITVDLIDEYLNYSCVIALTDPGNKALLEIFAELEKNVFVDEETVTIGLLLEPPTSDVYERRSKTLVWKGTPHVEDRTIVFFPRAVRDRTCLIAPPRPSSLEAELYQGPLTLESLTSFVNNKCGAFRKEGGYLTPEGLHREYIMKNLFRVSDIGGVTMEEINLYREGGLHYCEDSLQDCPGRAEQAARSAGEDAAAGAGALPECERIPVPADRRSFFDQFLKRSKPVIIEGALENWPALHKWTNEYLLEKYGEREVHIKLAPDGEFEGCEPVAWWQNHGDEDSNSFEIPANIRVQLEFPDLVVVRPATMNIKFSQFMEFLAAGNHRSGGNSSHVSAYLEYSSILQYMPDLEDDVVEFPFMKRLLTRKHLNLWLSDGNTLGKLHFDPFDNLLCQISGAKEVTLFEPYDNKMMYEGHIPEAILSYHHATGQFERRTRLDSTSMVMSPVDILKPDFMKFPNFADTRPLNCTIGEGDVLFMPAFWWHEVQSYPNQVQHRNLAVNFWYEPFFKKDFPCADCKFDINPAYFHLL